MAADLLGAAAPTEVVQALHRPVLCGEGPGHRRSVPEPAGQGDGALRRREDPDPSPGSDSAAAAYGTGLRGGGHA